MTLHDDPLPTKPGCTDPHLGAMLSRRLGSVVLPPELAEHLRLCPACQLEQQTFDSLDDTAVELPPDFLGSLRRALDDLQR
ncbi:MAG: hypothetical protein KDK70_10635 [Myxococcales bacterium]|nr:hypothetical protein [Myxococcales bacterium]